MVVKSGFVGSFDCVVEVGGDLEEVIAVIPVEVSYGFEQLELADIGGCTVFFDGKPDVMAH